MRVFFLALATFAFLPPAEAQLDPSNAILIQGSKPSTREGGIDSGRYTIKSPRNEDTGNRRTEPRRPTPAVPDDEARPIAQESPALVPTSVASEQATQPVIVEQPQPGTFLSGAPPPLPAPPPLSQVLMGGTGEEIDHYRQVLNQDDRRLNLLEVSFAPAFIYNDSQSPYAYRDYTTAGPGFHADARVWFSPFFAVQGSYSATLSGHVSDSFTSTRSVAATHQWVKAGIRSRRFLSASRSSPSLSLGIDYYEYQMRIPQSALSRGKIRTTGPQLTLEGDWPTSNRYSWLLGVSLLPKARHKESATSLDLRSGANTDTNGVGFSLGGRLQHDRSGAMFFRLSHTIEKNLYSGTAGLPDPITGTTPNGVPILNSFTIFQIGYTWGN